MIIIYCSETTNKNKNLDLMDNKIGNDLSHLHIYKFVVKMNQTY